LHFISDDWGMPVAVVASSAIFGLAHLANPHADIVSTLYLIVAGILFACGYILFVV